MKGWRDKSKMKKNKLLKKSFLLIISIFVTMFAVLCFSDIYASEFAEESFNKTKQEEYLVQFLDSLNNKDEEAAFGLWIRGDNTDASRNSFTDDFQKYLEIWGDKKTYTYTKSGEKYWPAEGKRPAGVLYSYQVKCPEDVFLVELSIDDNYNGMAGLNHFKLTRKGKAAGTYNTWREFDFSQWFMAFCAIIEVVFTLYTSRTCIKKKQKLWGLWLFLIMIVYGGVCFTVTEKVQVGFFVYTLFMPKIIKYSTGIQVFLSVPVGAITYWIFNHNKRIEIKKDIN